MSLSTVSSRHSVSLVNPGVVNNQRPQNDQDSDDVSASISATNKNIANGNQNLIKTSNINLQTDHDGDDNSLSKVSSNIGKSLLDVTG